MKRRIKFGSIGLAVALVTALLVFLLPAGLDISTSGEVSITLGTYDVLASPGEVTYYFDAYHSTEKWTTTPEYMVDNVLTNYASTTVNNQVERLTGNTCPGDDLGTITKVEIRAYAYGDGNDELYLRPEFTGGTGDNHITVPGTSGGWGAYQNVTNDTNAPSPWTWSAIQDLECDIEYDKTGSGATMYASKVEIRVTYSTGAPKGGSVAFVRATEGAIVSTVLTLNIEVSVGTDRVLVVGLAYKSNTVLAPTSILFNTSESFSVELSAADGGDAQCFLYYLAAPTETTADVVITMPGEVRMVGYVAYFTGVDQNNPFTATTSENMGTNNAPTVDVSSTADEIVIDIMAQVSAGPDTIDSNSGTLICSGAATGGGSDTRGGGQYEVGQATRIMSYTMSGADNWNIVAGALQESLGDIDVGADPIDRGGALSFGATGITKDNPANASGVLHTVKVYAREGYDITGLIVGTFYTTNGNILKCRDSELVGDVTAGAVRTFTNLSIAVETGDYIGCYFTSGRIEVDASGFAGKWTAQGEFIDPGDETGYAFQDGDAISLYGYGDTGAVPDITSAPDTWTLNGIIESGVIQPDTIYYANPQGDTQVPASTVTDADCRFTVTNTSAMAIDLTCTMGSFSGGDGNMTNSDDGSNGATTYGAHSWFSGQLYANKVIIKSSGSSVGYDGLAATTDIKWGAEVETQTNAWAGGNSSTATLTITATVD